MIPFFQFTTLAVDSFIFSTLKLQSLYENMLLRWDIMKGIKFICRFLCLSMNSLGREEQPYMKAFRFLECPCMSQYIAISF